VRGLLLIPVGFVIFRRITVRVFFDETVDCGSIVHINRIRNYILLGLFVDVLF
jgi:hypothetical protein